MSKKGFKLFCASVFIFIFSAKMIISVAPLFVGHVDSEYINAVIMQLEIENDTKSSETKNKIEKEFWKGLPVFLTFSNQLYYFNTNPVPIDIRNHIQSFYPSVPTPPPNI